MPPPRGGGGARGRLLSRGSEAVSPPPRPLPHPATRAAPLFRAAHGWRLEPQRCVCEGGRLRLIPDAHGAMSSPRGYGVGGGVPLPRSGNSHERRELSSVGPGVGGTAPGMLPASRDPQSRREELSNAGPSVPKGGWGYSPLPGSRCLPQRMGLRRGA